MRKINNRNKRNNYTNMYQNIPFGMYYDYNNNEEYSEDIVIENGRDKNKTTQAVKRIHKPRNTKKDN